MEMFLSNVDATKKLKELQTPLVVPNQVQQLQFVPDLIVLATPKFIRELERVSNFN